MREHRNDRDDLPPERTEHGGKPPADKAEELENERGAEREEGLTAERRGSPAAPSDRPENDPPHPQDVNEIGEPL